MWPRNDAITESGFQQICCFCTDVAHAQRITHGHDCSFITRHQSGDLMLEDIVDNAHDMEPLIARTDAVKFSNTSALLYKFVNSLLPLS